MIVALASSPGLSTPSRSLWFRGLFELAMVFLGVMGAFVVDGWRQDREERATEIQYLERLAVDLRRDSTTIENGWAPQLGRKLGALHDIEPFVRGRTREVGDTMAFVKNVALAGAGGFTAWLFDTPTWDDLTSTGNLRLIHDPGLRDAIVAYYRFLDSETGRVQKRLPNYPMAVHALIPAEAREDVTMELLRSWDLTRILDRVRTESFVDVFNQEYNSGLFQQLEVARFREAIRTLLVAVEEELATHGAR